MRWVVWWSALTLVWVASLTTVTWPEIAVAAAGAGVCALVAVRARNVVGGRGRVRAAWLRGLRALPRAVLADTFAMWRAAVRRADGELREVRLGHDRSRARQATAVMLLSTTPATLVVDVDRGANVALVHGFGESESAMERAVRW